MAMMIDDEIGLLNAFFSRIQIVLLIRAGNLKHFLAVG